MKLNKVVQDHFFISILSTDLASDDSSPIRPYNRRSCGIDLHRAITVTVSPIHFERPSERKSVSFLRPIRIEVVQENR